MKQFQVLLIVLTGAAAAIPGIAATRQFGIPPKTEPLFEFVLVTFSSAVVLLVYVLRGSVERLSKRVVTASAITGIFVLLLVFVMHVWLTNLVLVEHSFEGENIERQFFPLFINDSAQADIRLAGSRRAFISNPPKPGQGSAGPAAVLEMTSEWNTALTLGILLISYTAMIVCVALIFSFLGFHALRSPIVEPSGTNRKNEEVPDC